MYGAIVRAYEKKEEEENFLFVLWLSDCYKSDLSKERERKTFPKFSANQK